MSLKPLDPIDLLSRFEFKKPSKALESVRARSIELLRRGKLSEAADHARDALRDGNETHDRHMQVYACAYLAVVHARQEDFEAAAASADDCYRLSKQMRSQHNTAIARALLATVHQQHLEMLGVEFVKPIREVQDEFDSLATKALAQGQVAEADKNRAYLVEFGEQGRRARWIPALPYTLPLIWLPALDPNPKFPPAQSSSFQGYMEPVLFVLRSKQQAADDQSGKSDPGTIDDELYTARPLPDLNNPDATPLHPPRLDPSARYWAIKIDPESARLPGFDADDYLLVRVDDPTQFDQQIAAAGGDFTGWKFERTADGGFRFTAIPPKFVGAHQAAMLVLKVDAILRRVR
ncbi:MAG TPA: hypothetical protein VJ793_06920 [Anaerolineae bacterium]|nr:hypothetical protein [Anaerolineae bacterium]